jgi:hypothetical protein
MAKNAVSAPEIKPEAINRINNAILFRMKLTETAKSGRTIDIESISNKWSCRKGPGSKENRIVYKRRSAKLINFALLS